MQRQASAERQLGRDLRPRTGTRFLVATAGLVVVLLIGSALLLPLPGGPAPAISRVAPADEQGTGRSPPPILSFTATPNPTEVGVQGFLAVTVLGNITLGDTFAYSGLPTGCSSSSLANLSCTPTVSGTYEVTVSITNALGLVHSTLNWTVEATLQVAITATASSSPLTVALQADVQGGVALSQVAWNFGDGTTASGALDVSHTYASAGTYVVAFQAVDQLAVSALARDNVTVSPPVGTLVAVAEDTTTTGPAPLAVQFEGSASGGVSPYTFAWAFGDGTVGAGASPSHTYTAQGDFEAVLTVTDAASVSAQDSVLVVVLPPVGTLSASAQASVAVGTAPLAVAFQGSAQGGVSPYTYAWTFGDGSASVSGAAVAHTYATAGSFDAALKVTDSVGATAVAQVPILVRTPAGDLIASASAIVTTGTAPFLASFSASASGGAGPYNFSWNFDDGSAGAWGSLVAHLYTQPGTYLATVSVTDAAGNVTVAHAQVSVSSPVVGALIVTAGTTVTSGVAPLTVGFDALASGGVGPYTYLWSFGDGATSLQADSSYVFVAAGSYTATVVATDSLGASAVAYANVQVLPSSGGLSVAASYTVGASTTDSETVDFQSSVTGGAGPYAYLWTFDDGSASVSSENVAHTFTSSGDFAIVLVATDAAGANATYDLNLVVAISGLLIVASSSATAGSANLSWSFQAAAAGGSGPYTYSWTFGDGSPAGSGALAAHTYAKPGTYDVQVTATDAQGQSTVHDLVVSSPAPAPTTPPHGPGAMLPTTYLVAIGAAVAAAAIVAVLAMRRRQAGRGSPEPGSAAGPGREASGSTASSLEASPEEVPVEKDTLADMF